jgi:SCY1-like protein 1
MWSFWSRDPTKDFGYEIGEIITSYDQDKSIWVLHKGKKKVSLIIYINLRLILI